jgi:hypothetical protein
MVKREERQQQMTDWVKAAKPGELVEMFDNVSWGVWFELDNEEVQPPRAVFRSEDEARGYAAMMGYVEYHVGPVIMDMCFRNRADVPEAS